MRGASVALGNAVYWPVFLAQVVRAVALVGVQIRGTLSNMLALPALGHVCRVWLLAFCVPVCQWQASKCSLGPVSHFGGETHKKSAKTMAIACLLVLGAVDGIVTACLAAAGHREGFGCAESYRRELGLPSK